MGKPLGHCPRPGPRSAALYAGAPAHHTFPPAPDRTPWQCQPLAWPPPRFLSLSLSLSLSRSGSLSLTVRLGVLLHTSSYSRVSLPRVPLRPPFASAPLLPLTLARAGGGFIRNRDSVACKCAPSAPPLPALSDDRSAPPYTHPVPAVSSRCHHCPAAPAAFGRLAASPSAFDRCSIRPAVKSVLVVFDQRLTRCLARHRVTIIIMLGCGASPDPPHCLPSPP